MRARAIISRGFPLVLGALLALPLRAETLRLVTINVWSGLTYEGVFKMGAYETAATRTARTELLKAELKGLDADVVACNEANKLPGYARLLADGLGDDYVYHIGLSGVRLGPIGIPVNLREGDVILAKKEWRLKSAGRRRLSGGPVGNCCSFHLGDATQVIAGRIMVAGHPLYIFNTHWQSDPKDPRTSLTEARKTIAFVNKVAHDHPAVLLGDLNATADAPAVNLLEQAGFIDACAAFDPAPAATWDELLNTNIQMEFSSRPKRQDAPRIRKRIDYIFLRGKELKVLRAGLVLDKPVAGLHPSDHFGVMVEVDFSPLSE